MSTTVLVGGLVVPLDGAGTNPGIMDLVVRDGRIESLGPSGAAPPADAERVDCRGRVVMPGLVNAHLHPDLHLLRGMVEDLSLHEWESCERLQRSLVVLDGDDAEPLQRAAVRGALAECALAGVTRVACYGVTRRIERIAAEEMAALGLSGWVTIRDAAFPQLAEGEFPHMYRLHAEEVLYDEELRAAAAAHERGERLVMHVAETRERVAFALDRFGTTPIRLLARYGLLSPRVLLSHAIHVDDEEIALIAAAGAPVLASPVAEAKLADGLAPIAAMHDRGVRIALGTDAAVCNNSCDVLLEARFLGLLQRLSYGPATLPAGTLLRFATVDGAAALDSTASQGLSAGAPADIAVLDATAPHMLPLVHGAGESNLLAGIVFSGSGRDVTDVMAGGRWIVRSRRLVALDEDEIGEALAEAAAELIRRTGG